MSPASNLFEKESLGSPRVLLWFRGRPSIRREFCCHGLEVFFRDWQCCLNNGRPSLVPKWNLTTLILLYIRKPQEFCKDTDFIDSRFIFFSLCKFSPWYFLPPPPKKYVYFLILSTFIALTLRVPSANKSCAESRSWDRLNISSMEHRRDGPVSKGARHQARWP